MTHVAKGRFQRFFGFSEGRASARPKRKGFPVPKHTINPALASEKLLEDEGIPLDHETISRWPMAEGKLHSKGKPRRQRKRRERRPF